MHMFLPVRADSADKKYGRGAVFATQTGSLFSLVKRYVNTLAHTLVGFHSRTAVLSVLTRLASRQTSQALIPAAA